MRKTKHGHPDTNQADIVKQLRRCGFTVAITTGVGNGFPDIVVGARKRNFLFEIKDGDKIPSKRQLSPAELEWHQAWHGQVDVIESVDDALKIINR